MLPDVDLGTATGVTGLLIAIVMMVERLVRVVLEGRKGEKMAETAPAPTSLEGCSKLGHEKVCEERCKGYERRLTTLEESYTRVDNQSRADAVNLASITSDIKYLRQRVDDLVGMFQVGGGKEG